jgi:hypothetical protein
MKVIKYFYHIDVIFKIISNNFSSIYIEIELLARLSKETTICFKKLRSKAHFHKLGTSTLSCVCVSFSLAGRFQLLWKLEIYSQSTKHSMVGNQNDLDDINDPKLWIHDIIT